MKALVQSGLVVALGLLAAHSFAQEVQWRARGANSAPAVSETATAAPAASRAPLGQPLAPANTAAVRPIDFRPLPTVFRAKTDEPRPLPSGPALGPMPAINGDSIKVIVDEPAKDEKKDEKKEKLTFPPKLKIMPAPDGVYSSQSLVCPSSCCC